MISYSVYLNENVGLYACNAAILFFLAYIISVQFEMHLSDDSPFTFTA